MPERFARLAGLALIVVLILALPLLISLFAALQTKPPARTPTAQTAIAQTTATRSRPPPSPSPAATRTPSRTPSPTNTALAGATPTCPNPATPEPFWVDPVVSPTNLLSQKISVTLGRGREISIANEAGTITQRGEFSVAQPVVIEAPLRPNATNHLVVSGKVEYAPGCFYTLSTQIDRLGNPLVIVQSSAGNLTPSVTAPAPGTVYLKPFSQVVGLGQDTPNASDKIWLYEANADAPFQILARQGAFTRLASQGGALNFWTLNDNVVTTPMPEPKYEMLIGEPQVDFVPGTIFACEGRAPRGLILGACAEFQNLVTAQAIQRATVETSVLYLVRFDFQTYWVSAHVLKNEPP
ncbi:MAG: hypothetical protein HY741_12800 [Chloroflexi bacterium]|nr:hypothetical protein [Chloroflexota bacterium]